MICSRSHATWQSPHLLRIGNFVNWITFLLKPISQRIGCHPLPKNAILVTFLTLLVAGALKMASKHPQKAIFFLVFHSDFGCLEVGGGEHPPPLIGLRPYTANCVILEAICNFDFDRSVVINPIVYTSIIPSINK